MDWDFVFECMSKSSPENLISFFPAIDSAFSFMAVSDIAIQAAALLQPPKAIPNSGYRNLRPIPLVMNWLKNSFMELAGECSGFGNADSKMPMFRH